MGSRLCVKFGLLREIQIMYWYTVLKARKQKHDCLQQLHSYFGFGIRHSIFLCWRFLAAKIPIVRKNTEIGSFSIWFCVLQIRILVAQRFRSHSHRCDPRLNPVIGCGIMWKGMAVAHLDTRVSFHINDHPAQIFVH